MKLAAKFEMVTTTRGLVIVFLHALRDLVTLNFHLLILVGGHTWRESLPEVVQIGSGFLKM